MDCRDARAGLWPPERPRLAGAEIVAAREHVSSCAECSEFFAQERALLDAYRDLGDVRAPLVVRERVFDALATARAEALDEKEGPGPPSAAMQWGRFAWPGVAVGLIAVLAFVPALAWPGPSTQDDGGVFVEDYLRRAVGQDHLITSDPDEVRRFLVRELGIEVGPLRSSGLELRRVEICLLEGRRGAMIVYAKEGASVSHYVVPRLDTRPREPTLSKPTDPISNGSLPVVTWSTDALEQALVGDLASSELLQIARGEALQ
jgi:hypothetical protein